MSQLIAAIFYDEHRAFQVLSDLRRLSGSNSDLEHALIITWGDSGPSIQQSMNLAERDPEGWSRLWGSFLKAMMIGIMPTPAISPLNDVSMPAALGAQTASAVESEEWWRTKLKIPHEFLRDVGALIRPGNSAFFGVCRSSTAERWSELSRGYGGTFLSTTLDRRQMNKIRALVKAKGTRTRTVDRLAENNGRTKHS
jgi:uncharacterized membrane protein